MALKKATTRRIKPGNTSLVRGFKAGRRRAPIRAIQSESSKQGSFSKPIMALMAFLVLGGGAGVVIGVTDNGVINVATVVSERNEQAIKNAAPGEEVTTVSVPKNDTAVRTPNGGLSPGLQNSLPPPPPVVEEIAVQEDEVNEGTTESEETTNADTEESVEADTEVTEVPIVPEEGFTSEETPSA